MPIMADNGSGTPPILASWAEVDPKRYPFDAMQAATLIRTELPEPAEAGVEAWRDAVSVALCERYGPWAYYWYWSPQGRQNHNWITRFPPPAQAPSLAVESLLSWRRWAGRVAERFDEFLPLLTRAAVGTTADLATTWESAVTALCRAAIASVVDDDYWPGSCRRVLQWFLTAAGMPVEQAGTLVADAVDRRLDHWVPPTAVHVAEVAERLTRGVLSTAGIAPAGSTEWPDTWPADWPVWRATNTTGPGSV